MGKGANKQLLANSGTAQNRSGALNSKANSVYGTLDPALTAEATNPQGIGATGLAAENTANQQSLGGSTAGITGQSNLTAARTRNAGGFQGAIGSGSRAGQRNLAQNAVQIQAQNEQLKQAQQQTALSQIQQLYGTNLTGAKDYLDSSKSALEAENTGSMQANQTLWNNINGITGLAGKAATAGVGCWIAAAVYDGWDDPRTIAVREWLNTEFIKSALGRIVMATYLKFGERIADQIKRKPVLKHIFKPLFDAALRRARAV